MISEYARVFLSMWFILKKGKGYSSGLFIIYLSSSLALTSVASFCVLAQFHWPLLDNNILKPHDDLVLNLKLKDHEMWIDHLLLPEIVWQLLLFFRFLQH